MEHFGALDFFGKKFFRKKFCLRPYMGSQIWPIGPIWENGKIGVGEPVFRASAGCTRPQAPVSAAFGLKRPISTSKRRLKARKGAIWSVFEKSVKNLQKRSR